MVFCMIVAEEDCINKGNVNLKCDTCHWNFDARNKSIDEKKDNFEMKARKGK